MLSKSMEDVNYMLCENVVECACSSQYRLISLLRKLFESMILKKLDELLHRNNFLRDNQISVRSTADVISVIIHRISETLENKLITRVIAINI